MSNIYDNIDIYQSCSEVEYFTMIMDGYIVDNDRWFAPCCTLARKDMCSHDVNNPEESINNFNNLRYNIIDENKRVYYTDNKERIYTSNCVNCPSYIVNNWENRVKDQISYLNLSVYPSPCQAKCIYCCYVYSNHLMTDKVKEAYNKLFTFFEFIKSNNILNESSTVQISSGEITIHPYKDKILDLVDGLNVNFLSNCMLFDQRIAEHLKNNPYSTINLSIDSGTSSTWKKVKGLDNFDTVINNLRKYYQYCDQKNHQQLTLKYIVIPKINSCKKDFIGVIKIMRQLDIQCLQISRNLVVPIQMDHEHHALITSVVKLATLCRQNGIAYYLHPDAFTVHEIDRIHRTVEFNIQTGIKY